MVLIPLRAISEIMEIALKGCKGLEAKHNSSECYSLMLCGPLELNSYETMALKLLRAVRLEMKFAQD